MSAVRSRSLRKAERQQKIMIELHARPTVRIAELAQAFGVTTETVRRDLDELSDKGFVTRTYGGAAPSIIHEPDLQSRHRRMVWERARIAKRAAALVEPDDVVLIDVGSTTTHFARQLSTLPIPFTAITNSVSAAAALARARGARVLLCPGEYDGREGGVFGVETVNFIGRFRANKAFIGAGGLTTEGPTEVDSQASWVKRAMIERAQRTILLADHGKFGVQLFEVVCPLPRLSALVTDREPPSDLRAALEAGGVSVLVAG
ncbi:MAG TPA: DeoR/GlpR family DNA-binding transcription regulator [Thermodesulfobacteriota bacterium]